MKKDLAIIAGLFVIISVLLIFGQGFTSTSFIGKGGFSGSTTKSAALKSGITIKIKTLDINASVAATGNERKKGLSKRDSLNLNEGMLFVFDQKGPYAIWMKDMKFAIDIIWLSEDKKIIDIVPSAPAEPKKRASELTIYKPQGDAKYVLEINAGLSKLNDLQVGDVAQF